MQEYHSEIHPEIKISNLQVDRPRAMYDRNIHRYLKKICVDPFMEQETIQEDFFRSFDWFVRNSRLNKVSGLEGFPDLDVIQGVTHVLDDLHQMYSDRIVVLSGEYSYHWRLRSDITVRTLETLSEGDILILSSPFPSTGDIHQDYDPIIKKAEKLGVQVHIDACWYGCTRGLHFDFTSPAIQSVSFSLSKSMGMGANRIGIRYARKRWNGPITIMNRFNMSPRILMWMAIKIMDKFGPDYLQNRYFDAYKIICSELDLEQTPTIHLAMHENQIGDWTPVGLRTILRAMADH